MTHDANWFIAAIDWTPVLVAIITLIGVFFNGWIALKLHAQLKTPSGTSIGKQVENINHIAIGTHHAAVKVAREMGIKPEPVPDLTKEELAGD